MTVQLYSYIILGTRTLPVTFYINFCIHNKLLKNILDIGTLFAKCLFQLVVQWYSTGWFEFST